MGAPVRPIRYGDQPVTDGDADADPIDGDIEQETTDPCDPNPCNAGENRVCEEGTGNCLCDTGFCDINATCIADDTKNPDHDCSVCDSTANKNDWSLRGTDYECRASAGECDVAEVCDGVSSDCPVDGFVDDGEVCEDDDDSCNGVSTCISGSCDQTTEPVTCSALDECHVVGTCDTSTGICSNPTEADSTACETENQCVAGVCKDCFDTSGCADFTEDTNSCTDLACEANVCTNVNDDSNSCTDDNDCTHSDLCSGGVCSGTSYICNDDKTCTTDTCNGDGTCSNDILSDKCLIEGTCYTHQDDDPANECQWCLASQSNTSWTGKVNGFACTADENDCTDDICNGSAPSTCTHPINDSNTCDDDNDCTDNDSCSSGSCSGSTYDCNDAGICNNDDDVCTCIQGYAGDYCDECADGYSGYPDCERDVTPGFVPITAGSFWMGSPQSSTCPAGYPGVCEDELGNYSDEVLHEVTLTYDFEMSRYEITEAEFEGLMGWNAMDTYDSDCIYGCGDDHPMKYISWYDTLAYANQLSLDAGLTECYVLSNVGCEYGGTVGSTYMDCFDGDATYGGIDSATVTLAGGATKPQDCEGYRLPTEAEWEYAIRAGTNTAFYNGGITNTSIDPNMDLIGWYSSNNGSYGTAEYGTKPVGGKAPNAWGLYDMSGNLWEWTWDWYQEAYQNDGATDPVGPVSGSGRVVRGGYWSYFARRCRSAHRGYNSPGYRSDGVGARLSRSSP